MITNIRLQNFRSYADASFEFDPGPNIIVGANASGKTNLLEAVMVLARGGSYRAKDVELIKHNAPWARLDGLFGHQNRTLKLEPQDASLSKSFLIDNKAYSRLSLERSLPLVYFEPEHLQSLTRGPAQRRDYFDDLLERTQPGFKQLAAAYRRTLAQRNALLKRGSNAASQQAFAWDVRLGELGSQIAAYRQELISSFNKRISAAYSQIAGRRTKVIIEYQIQFAVDSYASQMVSALEKNLQRDLARGFSGYGPHREDFKFLIGNQPIDSTASRGEIRSLLLSLKKLELVLVEKAGNQKPILLLDDVLSELDGARRQALVEMLKDYQSILTTTDADTVLEYFATGSHKILALG